ncbi:uncharacterized protein BP5553_00977 [Venustampulla echinocandica]|uniref:Cupredoxin n=1 Tax=Venustampulla echinocandica TaxID=2656787 RepID=A0A370TZS2_9HELO|nr:uncharacterized protein BP5553_00977 [Venustampulla echinocandica]RDL40998.1 hypothetical protein BP5553_00977 [Venustampulla echinocandica]
MKFSTITALGGLLGIVSAGYHTQEVVCTDPEPTTVYRTVTVTEGAGGSSQPVSSGVNHQAGGSKYPYVTTGGGQVTSVDYNGSKTSVWVYPTGPATSKDCTVAIYEVNVAVTVIIININVTIVNGKTITITKTVSGVPPTTTPVLPPTPGSTNPPTSTGAIHKVIVGADGQLKYRDNQVNAAIGDIIRFDFNSTNHTVTQSSFNDPCVKLPGGFDTGFNQFNNQSKTGIIFRDFKVEVSSPLWFYCSQKAPKSHCQAGMVLGVNPAGKFPAFLDKATNTASIGLPTGTGPAGKPTGMSILPKWRRSQAWSA